ncbi:hypothetical protein ACF3MZ_02980 [Paenibacillaceae bacterium WGS1546]|uniref:hypothetical protein n=1 Tax=Cohnella sp. WGS1546 TaxID=3366810 RepID=UPI00372D1F2E
MSMLVFHEDTLLGDLILTLTVQKRHIMRLTKLVRAHLSSLQAQLTVLHQQTILMPQRLQLRLLQQVRILIFQLLLACGIYLAQQIIHLSMLAIQAGTLSLQKPNNHFHLYNLKVPLYRL